MYKCLEDNVLTLPINKESEQSEGGIALPDQMRTKPVKAEVLAVGPGMKMDDGGRFPMTTKVGDIVVYPKKSGDQLYLDGQEVVVIPERYILMVVGNVNEEKEDQEFYESEVQNAGHESCK